jgi:transposase-like protein
MRRTLRSMPVDVAAVMARTSSISAAARELGVHRSTVQRWIGANKAPRPSGKRARLRATPATKASQGVRTAAAWARAVRRAYELTPTEEALVVVGERAMARSLDPALRPEQQDAAARRFQSIVKQLNLEPEEEAVNGETSPARNNVRQWPRGVA